METNRHCLHGMTALPANTKVGDLLPVFSGVEHELRVGKPNTECASCRKSFNQVRKPRKAVRLYLANTQIPVAFSLNICGACFSQYQLGGCRMDAVLASVESFLEGNRFSA